MTRHKAVSATIGGLITVLGVLAAAVTDGTLTLEETGGVLTSVLTVGGTVYAVWRIPNQPTGPDAR